MGDQPNVDLMLGQRRRRYANIKKSFGQSLIFAGSVSLNENMRALARPRASSIPGRFPRFRNCSAQLDDKHT